MSEINRESVAPVFVVGTPRSGTTLTATILGQHPDLFMPGENHYFEMVATGDPFRSLTEHQQLSAIESLLTIYGTYNQVEDQARIDKDFRSAERRSILKKSASTYANLFAEFMQLQLIDSGKKRWGNQAPKDIFHLARIHQVFPHARFIICVRDPRDFLLSYKGRWRVSSHGERLQALYHPVLTSLLWRSTMQQVEQIQGVLPGNSILIVKYEELVRSPELIVRQMCEHVGLSYDANMLNDPGSNSSRATTDGGIYSSSIGRWREGLEPEEITICQFLTGPILKRYGYKLAATNANIVKQAVIWFSFPFSALRALYANRKNRGPLLSYLIQRGVRLVLKPKGFH